MTIWTNDVAGTVNRAGPDVSDAKVIPTGSAEPLILADVAANVGEQAAELESQAAAIEGIQASKLDTDGDGSAVSVLATDTTTPRSAADAAADVLDPLRFGAVIGGTEDCWEAIQDAIDACHDRGGGVVQLPRPGLWRVSQTVTVKPNVELIGATSGQSAADGACVILGDAGVSPIVDLTGGPANSSTALRRVTVRRDVADAASVPAGSIGVRIASGDAVFVEDVCSLRSAIGFQDKGQLGHRITGLNVGQVTDAFIEIDGAFEVDFYNPRCGKNGDVDYDANCYVRIKGGGDTYKFVSPQFNSSLVGSVNTILAFENYNSPNGIIQVVGGYAEQHQCVVTSDAATATIDRLSMTGFQANGSASDPVFALNGATTPREWRIDGAHIVGAVALTAPQSFTWTGGRIVGSLSLTGGTNATAAVTGVSMYGSIVAAGAWTDLSVIGPIFTAPATGITSTATGRVNILGTPTGGTHLADPMTVSGQIASTTRTVVASDGTSRAVGSSVAKSQVHSADGAHDLMGLSDWTADPYGAYIQTGKSRGGAIGIHGAVLSNDAIGGFGYWVSDGSAWRGAAAIVAYADAAPSGGLAPGRFDFLTTSSTTQDVLTLSLRRGIPFLPSVGTTAAAANMYMDPGTSPAGQILRSTSTGQWKFGVETLTVEYASALLGTRPVYHRSSAPHDPDEWSYYSWIAEEIAAADPRLAQWRPWTGDGDPPDDVPTVVHPTRGTVMVPDGVSDRAVNAMLTVLVQDLWRRVEALEARASAA